MMARPAMRVLCGMLLAGLAIGGDAGVALATPRLVTVPAPVPAPAGRARRELPETTARAFLAARPALLDGVPVERLVRGAVHELPLGSLVRLEQRAFGLPVLGAAAAVRLDAAGAVRWAAVDTHVIPRDFDPTPRLTADEARLAAVRAIGGALPGPRARAPRLVILPRPSGGVRLAWELRLPAGPGRAEPVLVWIDARDGGELGSQPLMATAEGRLANAYLDNPVATPELTTVDLGPLLIGDGRRLTSNDFVITACVDRGTCAPLFGGDEHPMCELEPTAELGDDGTFLSITRPPVDTRVDDAFAEVQLMFHLSRARETFRDLGFAGLASAPLAAIANVRFAEYDQACTGGTPPAGGELRPYINAAYVGAGGLELLPDADALIFGQATSIDFAYDGDVAYHELGHAVMFALVPELPYGPTFDERGADWTTGGMHEGLADYFSSVVTGNAPLGEYAGIEFDGDAIRTLDNTHLCPDSLIGEVHRDGEAFTAALWTIRESLDPGQKPYYDRAIYAVMTSLMGSDDQLSVARRVEAELALTFGDDLAALAAQVFAGRGFVDCNERVIDRPDGTLARTFGRRSGRATPTPGAVQVRLVNPAPAARLYVRVARARVEGVVALVARPGAAPLTWTYEEQAAHSDATLAGVLAFTDDTPDDDEPGTAEGTIEGPFPAGPVVVQFTFTGTTRLADLTFEFTDEHAPPDAGPPPDADDGDDGGGCGCLVGGREAQGGGAVGLGLAALLAGIGLGARRRRRRGPPDA